MTVIAVDFNDVLANAKEATRRALVLITGLVIKIEDFLGKDDVLNRKIFAHPEKPSLSRPITVQEWDRAKDLVYGEMFHTLTIPMYGAVEIMQLLAELGFEVHVVSTCGGLKLCMALKWLGQNRIPYVSVQTGIRYKAPAYRALGARMVIDNDPKHFKGVHEDIKSILLSAEALVVPTGVLLAKSWSVALHHVLRAR